MDFELPETASGLSIFTESMVIIVHDFIGHMVKATLVGFKKKKKVISAQFTSISCIYLLVCGKVVITISHLVQLSDFCTFINSKQTK